MRKGEISVLLKERGGESPSELQCLSMVSACHPPCVCVGPTLLAVIAVCRHSPLSIDHSPFEKQMDRPKLCAEESYHSYQHQQGKSCHGPWQRPAAGAERSPEGKWEQKTNRKGRCGATVCAVQSGLDADICCKGRESALHWIKLQ